MEDSVTESEKQVVFTKKIDDHDDDSIKSEKEEEKNEQGVEEEEEQVGFINQIISNFTPVSKQEDEDTNNKLSEENEEVKKEGGGLFSHIISNLVSSPRSGNGKQREGVFETPEKDGGAGDGDGDGGGIIDNIVSNLPKPLSDDAAPATDEASILIHSIIHD